MCYCFSTYATRLAQSVTVLVLTVAEVVHTNEMLTSHHNHKHTKRKTALKLKAANCLATYRSNECHQAFLQLDVNRLVLHRQLLVIDVKDTPCTLVGKAVSEIA